MNKLVRIYSAMMLMAAMAFFSACEKTFDAPPGPQDPNLVANMTIEDFKALHTTMGGHTEITQDIVISGVVVANDRSGNFYKQLFIQDTTGAIQVLLNANSLYTSYPVGRRVFVKAKGLYLSDDNRTMVLGTRTVIGGLPSVEGIPSALISQYIIGGSIGNPVEPIEVDIAQLQTDMHNRFVNALIKLKNYEFITGDTAKTYSDTSQYRRTTNLSIKDCLGNPNVTVRTSAYANFAGLNVPNGMGDITAIFTLFGTTRQLVIRDTTDVQFYGDRCDSNPPPPPPGTLLFQNFETQTPDAPISITGWTNIAETGTRTWNGKIFNNNKYAEATAFGSNAPSIKIWMVSGPVNMDVTINEKLTFDTKQGFIGTGGQNAATLKVMVSTNYTGTGNPWTATWTDLTGQATLSAGTVTSYPSTYTNSGLIDLNSYTGTLYVAFVYEGADPAGTGAGDKTSNWQIDNVSVIGD